MLSLSNSYETELRVFKATFPRVSYEVVTHVT